VLQFIAKDLRRKKRMGKFVELLKNHWQDRKFLCVGLDSDYEKLPEAVKQGSVAESLFAFNREIIDATAAYCCAFKPNIAFYEGYGWDGLEALVRTNRYIRANFPAIPIILDAKRADIGNTNQGYVKAVRDIYGADAITVHPYLGKEALKPFLDQPDLGVIVLCHTSNPGAGEFQELQTGGIELYKKVAVQVSEHWNYNQNCGLVVGATYPEEVGIVRSLAPNLPLLLPGIGAQGGNLEKTIAGGLDSDQGGIIINASRSVIYASSGKDFAEAAHREAAALNDQIYSIFVKKYLKKS
jgi:orotidine-5'-phosphate decarboxylase